MKKLLVLLLLLGVGLVGVLYIFRPAKATDQPRRDKVDRGDIVEKVGIPGRVVPKGLTYVYTEVPAGRVKEVAKEADVGHAVQKTAPLLWLEDDLAQANLKKADGDVELAEAAVTQAKAAKKRALVGVDKAHRDWEYADASLKLAKSLGGSTEQAQKGMDAAILGMFLAQAQVDEADSGMQTAEARVRQAKAAQDVAKKTLNAMTVTAPIAGTILQRKVNTGDIITPQTTPILFVIAPHPNEMQIQAQVGEADVIKVLSVMETAAKKNTKAKARIKFDAYADSDLEFVGSVVQVAEVPTVPATRPSGPGIPEELAAALAGQVRYTVTIENIEEVVLDSKEGSPPTRPMRWPLKAGFTANVDLIIHQERDVVRVPSEALNYRPAALSKEEKSRIDERRTTDWRPLWIWTADQKAQLVFVKTGISDSGRTQLLEADGGHLEPGTEVIVEGAATNDKMPFNVKVF